MPKPINSPNTQYVTCRFDHHSFLRSNYELKLVVQAYRNISRTCKQYLYGDSNAEQFLILELRNQFKLPFYCETPVELIKDGAVHTPLFSKEDLLIKSIEIMNYSVITITLFNSLLMNFKINTLEGKTKLSRLMRKEKGHLIKFYVMKLSIYFITKETS